MIYLHDKINNVCNQGATHANTYYANLQTGITFGKKYQKLFKLVIVTQQQLGYLKFTRWS